MFRALIPVLLASLAPAVADWPGWGGPNGDFTLAPVDGLAKRWPEAGPTRLWHRELGVGYSGIVSDGEVLYTMYRGSVTAEEDVTIALDARTGKTIWERRNPVPASRDPDSSWGGQGPNATPLIVGDRLYTIGSRAVMQALDRPSGKVVWTHDLVAEFGATFNPAIGYSISPIAYKGTIIVPVGREADSESGTDTNAGRSLIAFDQRTGRVAWKSLDFQIRTATPILATIHGRNQLIVLGRQALMGIDPDDGTLLWSYRGGGSMPSPLRVDDKRVFFAVGADGSSSHMIRLDRRDRRVEPHAQWSSREMDVYLATPVRSGDFIIGSDKSDILAVDIATGELLWSHEGFESAWCVLAGDKVVLLDQNGDLAVATVSRQALTVHSRHRVAEKYSLTPPTLVGTTVYVRDRKHIMALNLGVPTD